MALLKVVGLETRETDRISLVGARMKMVAPNAKNKAGMVLRTLVYQGMGRSESFRTATV